MLIFGGIYFCALEDKIAKKRSFRSEVLLVHKVKRSAITIKGTKDAILFILDDQISFSSILEELEYKLKHHKAASLWEGPLVKVKIVVGSRKLNMADEHALYNLFSNKKNMVVVDVLKQTPLMAMHKEAEHRDVRVMNGVIRSGQVLSCTGHMLLLGDVNPGGVIKSTGSIYVLGAIKGVAHAGFKGDTSAVVAASLLNPAQLCIADTIAALPRASLPEQEVYLMCFAYLREGQVVLDKLSNLVKIRPELACVFD
ncbi:MAG: hypothetical protein RLZ12_52 [Bacillota bacterium]|jgi:septum site-determining protein MinC